MKIGTRLSLSLALPLAGVVVLYGILTGRSSNLRLQEELSRQGRAIARLTQLAMEDYLRDKQLEDARQLVDTITGFERVLGFRLFDADGSLIYASAGMGSWSADQAQGVRTALATGRAVEVRTRLRDEPIETFMMPLTDPRGRLLGAVEVHQLESFVEHSARASRLSIAVMTAVMILATTLVVLLVSRVTVGGPIEELVRNLRGVGSGDLAPRVPVRRRDEVGRLAEEFNAMCDRLDAAKRALLAEQKQRKRTEARLRNAERLAGLGRLTAGLAHEIGTPLNVISGRAEGLRRELRDSAVAAKHLRIITAQIDRIVRIVRDLLDFARGGEPRPAPLQITVVIRRVLELLEQRFAEAGVRVAIHLGDDLPALVGDADRLHQVFLNLATNAIDAMPGGGVLTVCARSIERVPGDQQGPAGPCLLIEFSDTGTGIAAENLGRVFDPFFSTKDVGKGTGLGLSVSYGIAREHGGFIEVESEVGRGTTFSVHLPVAAAVEGSVSGGTAVARLAESS